MAIDYKSRMQKYIQRIEELSGVKLRFYSCNGEWSSTKFTHWTYLNGYHSRRDICLFLEGIIEGLAYKECVHRLKYGMTIQEVCDQIADFTGDKKTEAMRKAKIFRRNCCVPLTKVVEIRLSFGKREDHDGSVTELPDYLCFRYKDSDGDGHVFSILE